MESATRNHHRPGGSIAPAAATFALAALLLALVPAATVAAGAASTNPGAAGSPPNTPGMVRVTVEVELTCPSCAQGLERRLGRLAHVAGVEVRSGDGRIVLTVEPGRRVELAAVHDTVRNAGFIPDRVTVTAVGRLIRADGTPALALAPDFALPLVPADRAAVLMADAGGQLAQVSGHWDAAPDSPWRLRIDSFEVIR